MEMLRNSKFILIKMCYVIAVLHNAVLLRNTLPCLLLLLSVIRILYKAGV